MNKKVTNAKYIKSKGSLLTKKYLNENYPELQFIGEIQKTGVIGVHKKTRDIAVVIRHPRWVLHTASNGKVSFGGKQTTDLVMKIMGKSFKSKASDIAQTILSKLKNDKKLPFNSLLIGKEIESVAISKDGVISSLPASEQIEFQQTVHEDALPPVSSIAQSSILRAEQILSRAKSHKDLYLMDTSAPLVGKPSDSGMQLNNGQAKDYIQPWSEHLKRHMLFSDKEAVGVLKQVAQRFGYSSFKNMLKKEGFQVGWPSVSCQTNYGLPHIQESNGEYTVPLEIAIAVADIFNSTFGAIADLLMCSSPLLYGFTPKVHGKTVKDYRIVLRYIFDGALPSSFISDVNNLKKRWIYGMQNGVLFTADRLSYQSKLPEKNPHAIIYGAARIRLESKELIIQSGRVENTIAGISPSLLDEIAHDAYLNLLYIAALQAVAKGIHPKDYFGKKYSLIADWRKRRKVVRLYNIYGSTPPEVQVLLRQAVGLLDDLVKDYPNLADMILFTKSRIQNITKTIKGNIDNYADSPEGPISDVILAMYQNGLLPVTICRKICDYQIHMAKIIKDIPEKSFFLELLNFC